MKKIRLFTIGHTKKSAETFFSLLREAKVAKVVDIRLRNTSQLAGFAKKEDLRYLLKAAAGIGYVHMPELAPTAELLDGYRKKEIGWEEYEARYRKILEERKLGGKLKPDLFDRACLLCAEPEAEHCHRRLAAEFMKDLWGDATIRHLE